MGHISTVEVRYAETDQMGIAHHSNYAVWFGLIILINRRF